MAESRKPVPAPRSAAAAGRSGLIKVAIVGAATLKGKELKEVLEERNFPAGDILLLDDEESLGQLDSVGEEITFIQAVTRSSFDNVDLVFFASDEAFTRKHWSFAREAGCAIVDLSFALEQEGSIAVRSPWLDKELEPQMEKLPLDLETTAAVTAHPAAVMLGLLLLRAQRVGAMRRAVATVYEPASELGKRGMDELHQQTLNLLSFHPMPKEIYDVQVAFNMLPRYGEEAKSPLDVVEARILRHLKLITRSRLEPPPLQLLQAPTFHGHNLSLYLEPERTMTAEALAQAIAGEHVAIVADDEDPPSNVNAAGQDDILVSVRPDASHSNGFWLWASTDNLKITALTAVECAVTLAAARPSGKIQ